MVAQNIMLEGTIFENYSQMMQIINFKSDVNAHIQCEFALPPQARISSFEIEDDRGTVVRSRMCSAAEIRNSKAGGDVRIKRRKNNVYSIELGCMPRGDVRLTVKYFSTFKGSARTCIAPIFVRGTEGPFCARIEILGDEGAIVECPSYEINVEDIGDRMVVTLEAECVNKDITFEIERMHRTLSGGWVSETVYERIGLYRLFPRFDKYETDRCGRVILLDLCAPGALKYLAALRAAALAFIERLAEDEEFDIIAMGESVHSITDRLKKNPDGIADSIYALQGIKCEASEAAGNIKAACKLIESGEQAVVITARYGADFREMVQFMMETPEFMNAVLINVGTERELLDLGKVCSGSLQYLHIYPYNDVSKSVNAFADRVMQGYVKNVSIIPGETKIIDLYPKLIPTMKCGEGVYISIRYDYMPPKKFMFCTEDGATAIETTEVEEVTDFPIVGIVYAENKVRELSKFLEIADERSVKRIKAEIEEISRKFGLLTSETLLVAEYGGGTAAVECEFPLSPTVEGENFGGLSVFRNIDEYNADERLSFIADAAQMCAAATRADGAIVSAQVADVERRVFETVRCVAALCLSGNLKNMKILIENACDFMRGRLDEVTSEDLKREVLAVIDMIKKKDIKIAAQSLPETMRSLHAAEDLIYNARRGNVAAAAQLILNEMLNQ